MAASAVAIPSLVNVSLITSFVPFPVPKTIGPGAFASVPPRPGA
jgi:hypothetical protein